MRLITKTLSLLLVLLLPLSVVLAEETKTDTAINMNSEDPILMQLQSMVGKSVTLKLSSGQEISGKVADVSKQYVHLTELASGMQFFDSIIRRSDVSAIVYRAKQ